jgi:hypothetical protein
MRQRKEITTKNVKKTIREEEATEELKRKEKL